MLKETYKNNSSVKFEFECEQCGASGVRWKEPNKEALCPSCGAKLEEAKKASDKKTKDK